MCQLHKISLFLRSQILKGRTGTSEDGGWAITYTGFILILLCFFIMLTSFASFEEGKIVRFVRSFTNALCILPGGLKFESGKDILDDSSDIVDKNSEIAGFSEDLTALANKLGLKRDIQVSVFQKGLVVRFSDTVMFDLGAAEISPEAIPLLEKIGSFISGKPYPIRIEGHTDNLPIHNERFPSNWELSTARAVNVLRYFIEEEKVSQQRLSAVGFGEFQPIFPNDSPGHRAKNRRVEIIIGEREHVKLPEEMGK
ncbi:MAG: flagellar motor protein MotB [Deltaproteobacteria bacterium]|nr:flagellar motor protein MotB [Deltaproteobacteria bacterium]MBW1736383.1 flagellar motor protein MotB [Deltaproteobacteria bacterium]MBW1908122.1 flagellar motor protein MotB [Deltaproteobacteria bacterium]MBW2032201.1 flagellar motor protein MotB [Deltaproteobacteria bacterium]MBW2113774.1 flagellar motor protein MotB [Deltaproteobacteria bacterium]